MDLEDTVYPGSFYTLMRMLERKAVPYDNLSDLPFSTDADLDRLAMETIRATPQPDEDFDRQDAVRKYNALQAEFDGCPQLWLVHAMVIAILRRNNPPEAYRQLFLRIWREQGQDLAAGLPVRWLISAATTFADHGETIEQRLGGQGLSMLFDLIKLHDSERRVSTRRNDRAFRMRPRRPFRDELAFGMEGYSLRGGDLDRIMLARLWRLAENDSLFQPLGFRMLNMVMTDRRTVFARVQQYRKRPSND